jgi:hypothetical protein
MRAAAKTIFRSSELMKITSFEEFKELARRGHSFPSAKEIVADLLTPVSAPRLPRHRLRLSAGKRQAASTSAGIRSSAKILSDPACASG